MLALTPVIRGEIEDQLTIRSKPKQVINYLHIHYPRLPFKVQDIYNIKHQLRQRNLSGKTPLHALLCALSECSELKDKMFWDFLTDENSKVIGLFLAPAECRLLLYEYPEVLIFDCTYKTNRYNISV